MLTSMKTVHNISITALHNKRHPFYISCRLKNQMLQIFNDHLANFKINSKQIYIGSRTENGRCIV